MTDNKSSPSDFRKIDPDDYINYEERFVEKGGGSGKTKTHQGKKTTQALQKHQRSQSVEQRRKEIEDSLRPVLGSIPGIDSPDIYQENLIRYCDWVEKHIDVLADLDPSDCVILFAKSGGPGGQNVNKRETKVKIVHGPTNIRVDNDQTRSQMQNKKLALEILQERLRNHLELWKEYLNPAQGITVDLIKQILD